MVFIVDTSQSVVDSNPNNARIFGDFVETVMDTWWKINEQIGLQTAFGLVEFATEVDTRFDLNRKWDNWLLVTFPFVHELNSLQSACSQFEIERISKPQMLFTSPSSWDLDEYLEFVDDFFVGMSSSEIPDHSKYLNILQFVK